MIIFLKPRGVLHLLQHACNPVDWYPWSKEAFKKAKSENKLMFLSIGYSTCHWCHVMAHEAFSNDDIAEFLNNNYVSIKVDREERPDIDETYMLACQLLSPNCGWPLNIIMTPDFKPVWAGSYFPVESKYGLPAFIDVLQEINAIWQQSSNRILEIGELVSGRMQEMQESMKASEFDKNVLNKAYDLLMGDFDSGYGGFNDAPKFPTPHKLSFLLRVYKQNSDPKALEIVEKTLQSMYRGGIFDHVGGGFHRYSTDKKWLIPHFEKMLYDQALITITYLEAYQVTGNRLYAEVAKKTLDYVLKDLTSPEGGFFAGVDADSEGEEGKFYVWTKAEIDRILGSDSDEFCKYFDISKSGNFEAGINVLHIPESINQYDPAYDFSLNKLYEERNKRSYPHVDRKIITSWNGLMIKALAMAGKVLNEDKYKLAAIKAGEFIMDKLSLPDGRLLRRYFDGDANIYGFVEDYSFLIYGFLELYQATFDTVYLKLSVILANRMIADFYDEENGGFYLTSKDIETPILKRKDAADEAMPSGNSIAALVLQELADITEEDVYLNLAAETIKAFSYDMTNYPTAYAQLLIALIYYFGEHRVFLVSENPDDKETNKIINVLNRKFLQDSIVLFKQAYNDDIDKIYESAQYKNAQDHKTLIYVCEKSGCRPSLKGITEIEKFLVENKL